MPSILQASKKSFRSSSEAKYLFRSSRKKSARAEMGPSALRPDSNALLRVLAKRSFRMSESSVSCHRPEPSRQVPLVSD